MKFPNVIWLCIVYGRFILPIYQFADLCRLASRKTLFLFSQCQNWADLNQDINSNYVLFSISDEGISVTESLSGICDVLLTVEGTEYVGRIVSYVIVPDHHTWWIFRRTFLEA